MSFGTNSVLEGVSNISVLYRYSAVSVFAPSTTEASQSCLCLCSAGAIHKSVPTAVGHETLQGLHLSVSVLMGCDCNDLTSILHGWYRDSYV